jgi:hypothetical protein
MTGITDERHMVEAGLALCAALRTVGRDPEATAKAIDEAEAHFNAVRTPGSSKLPKAEKPEKPAVAKKGQN